MQIYKNDKSFPYIEQHIEQLTPDRAVDQQERLDRLNLFHSIGLRLEKHQERVFAEGTVVRKGRDLAHVCVTVIDEGALSSRAGGACKKSHAAENLRRSECPKP